MTPDELAQSLGGSVGPAAVQDPAALAKSLGGSLGADASQPIQQDQAQPTVAPYSFGGFIKNAFGSVGQLIGNTASAVANVLNPNPQKNTLANLAATAGGAVKELASSAATGKPGQSPTFDNLINSLTQKYGSLEKIKQTAYSDPAGMALDLATLLDAGGVALKAAGATGAGKAALKAGKVVNPATQITKAVGKGAEKAGGVVEAPFAGSYQPEVAKAADELGVNLPASAASKSKFVSGGEALLSRGLFGEGVQKVVEGARAGTEAALEASQQAVQDLVDKTRNSINSHITTIVDQLKPEMTLDNPSVGKILKQGFEEYKNNFIETKDKLYDTFLAANKDMPAMTTNTETVLQELIDRNKKSFAPSDTTFFQNILDRIQGTNIPSPAMLGGEKLTPEMIQKLGLSPESTFENLKITRTKIGQRLKNPQDPLVLGHQSELQNLYSALTTDMDETLNRVGTVDLTVGTLSRQMAQINEYFKTGLAKINSKLGRSIERSNPEQLVKTFVKPNNATNLQNLKDFVSPDQFGEVSASFLKDIIEKSYTKTGEFDVAKFKAGLQKFDPATLKELLTPEQGQRLTEVVADLETADAAKKLFGKQISSPNGQVNLAKLNDKMAQIKNALTPDEMNQLTHALSQNEKAQIVKDALKRSAKTAEGSQTAFLTRQARFIGEGTSAAIELLKGDPRLALTFMAEGTAEYAATKLFTSEWGRKYLTTGFNTLRPFGRAIQRVAPIVGKAAQGARILVRKPQMATSAASQSTNNSP